MKAFFLRISVSIAAASAMASCSFFASKDRNQHDVLEKLIAKSIDLSGQPAKLQQFKGKFVLLNFWASWCQPCMEETPSLLKATLAFDDKMQLILVSEDADIAEAKRFLQLFPLAKSPHVTLIFDKNKLWQENFRVQKFPETFFFNSKGKLIKKFDGGIDWADPQISFFLKQNINGN